MEADRLRREENERLEAQRRENDEKQKLEIRLRENLERERSEASRRLKEEQERLEAEQQARGRLETERLEKERLDALRLENERQDIVLPEAKERKGEEEVPTPVADEIVREREQAAKGRSEVKQQQKKVLPSVFESTPSQEDGARSAPPGSTRIPPDRSQARTKWLLALALVLITAIGGVWFSVNRERKMPIPAISPSPTPTPTPQVFARAAYERGQAAYKRRNYSLAIAEYTNAIQLKPDYADAFYARIFLSSKANFKISPKPPPKPRRASPSLKNSRTMGLPRYLA